MKSNEQLTSACLDRSIKILTDMRIQMAYDRIMSLREPKKPIDFDEVYFEGGHYLMRVMYLNNHLFSFGQATDGKIYTQDECEEFTIEIPLDDLMLFPNFKQAWDAPVKIQ